MTARAVSPPSPLAAPSSHLTEHAAVRWPFFEEVLLIVALAATLATVWSARYFPYHDATNNLARYVLMDRAWFGQPASFVDVRLIPTPYIALDLLGVMCTHLFGPAGGLRAVAGVLVAAIPLGMYALLRATCPERRGWALVGVLCSLSFYLLIGFFNFVGGIGAALLWLAAWWTRRDNNTWLTRTALLVGLAAVFLVHLAGAMTVLVVLGVAYLIDLWTAYRERQTRSDPLRSGATEPRTSRSVRWLFTPRLTMLVAATAVVGLMSVVWHLSLGPEPPVASIPPDFRSIANKLANLASPFYSFSYSQMMLMAGGYLLSLAAFAAANRRTLRADVMLISAAGFLALFLVFPYRVGGAGFVDMRWLLPALVLPFCATAMGTVPSQRAWLTVPFVAALLHAGVVHRESVRLDSDLDAYRRVLDMAPPNARLLPLVADGHRYGRIEPYRHFALWHTIDGGGRVPGLLTEEERYDTNPPSLPHKFFGHFREPLELYYPDERWGTQVPFPHDSLDWRRIGADYDYVVVAGRDSGARSAVASHAEAVAERGAIALYRVHRAQTARGRRPTGLPAPTIIMPVAYHPSGSVSPGSVPSDVEAPTTPRVPPAAAAIRRAAAFAHPGGFYTQAQIAFVIGKIRAHEEPWSSAYAQLQASAGRQHGHQIHALATYAVPGYYQDQKGFFAATNGITGDADAAYVLALSYRLGGNTSDADLAQQLLNSWARTNTSVTGYDGQLSMAEVGVGFILSAELLSGYAGWADADRAAFQNWVRTVYLAQAVNPIKDRKNNWGDWGTFGAVTADYFLDDAAGMADETTRLQKHIDSSVTADGRMPEELARGAGGIWYTYFALAPMTAAARVVKGAGGPDLLDPASPSGKRIDLALGFLFSALQNPQGWQYGANPKVPLARDTWGYDLFEAMSDTYGNQSWADYAAPHWPIMNTGHHYAWTFPTLMKTPLHTM